MEMNPSSHQVSKGINRMGVSRRFKEINGIPKAVKDEFNVTS